MSADSEIRRLRDEIVSLRTQIGRESSTIASKRKSAATAREQARRSKSEATVRSKTHAADQYEAAALAAGKKRADLEGKVATKEQRLNVVLTRRDKDQAAAQKKALDSLKRQTDQAVQGFSRPPMPAPRFPTAVVETPISYDVFLSHASEDKDEVARPLADALTTLGVTVWFDELNIRVGQSIRRTIEDGIRDARFGLVIISKHFMVKQWTQVELDALWGKKLAAADDSLLPVWHKVTYDEVQTGLPLLAGIHALNTSTLPITKIAELVADAVKAPTSSA